MKKNHPSQQRPSWFKKKKPPKYRPLIRAPRTLLLLRISFVIIGAFYFIFHADAAPVASLQTIVAIALLLCLTYLLLYFIAGREKTSAEYIIVPFWLDIGGSLFVWLNDPLSPSPMLLYIFVAALINGVHNGFSAFRNVLRITAMAAPIVFTARSMMHGFFTTELVLLAIGTFIMLYLYLVITEINTLQDKTREKTADMVQTNKELQKTGRALQESEARYRAMFEESGAATVLAEERTTLITLANSKFEQLTKYKKSELCNTIRLSDLIWADDMERIRRAHHGRRMRPEGKTHPDEFECRLTDKKGNIRFVVLRFGLNIWHERLIVTMVDITAARKSKIAFQKYSAHLLELTKKLQESGLRYRNLFENTGTATILVEKNMRISMVNSRFEELTGYLKKDILNNKRLTEFIEKRSLLRIRRYHARRKKLNLPLPNEYECLFRDKARNLKHVIMKVYTPPGQENSIVSFFDITARKKAEQQLEAAHEKLKIMAISDELTGLANRRHFNECLSREWNRAKREHTPLSLILIDVDCFKAYNDTYGHQAGDHCLKKIADDIKLQTRRALDLAARFGGEEFAVILSGTDLKSAMKVAENMRSAVENSKIVHAASMVSPVVTLSLGVATVTDFSKVDPDHLIRKADQALYQAKNEGRNKTIAIAEADATQKPFDAFLSAEGDALTVLKGGEKKA